MTVFAEIIATVTEAFLIMSYLDSMLIKRYDNKWSVPLATLFLIFCVSVFDYAGMFVNYKVIILIFLVISISSVVFKDKFYKKILYIILSFALLLMADLITLALDIVITPYLPSKEFSRISMLFISKMIFFILVYYLKSRELNKYKDIKISIIYYIIISVIPLITILFFFVIYYFLDLSEPQLLIMVVFSSLMIFLNIFVVYIYTVLLKLVKTKDEAILMKNQYENQLVNLKYSEEKYNAVKSLKHDMKNHLLCIGMYADNKDYKSIKEYIDGISEKMNIGNLYIKSGNPVIDFIVNEKCEIAKSKNIKVNLEYDIKNKINIDDDDLCIVLSNLLDNAVESAAKTEKGYINIKIVTIKSMLKIYIENNFIGIRKVNNLKTEKEDKDIHGIGLKNIKSITDKYYGLCDIKINKNVFSVNILIPFN